MDRVGQAGLPSPADITRTYNDGMPRPHSRPVKPRVARSAAARLLEAEQLFADFIELTPYRFRPFVKSFDSFAAYERWKRAQTNPWYR